VRNLSKTPERQKSELFKKVEILEKYMKEMKEILKDKLINNHFVKEEVIVDVKYMNAGAPRIMLIDSRAPKSVVSKEWIEGYLEDKREVTAYIIDADRVSFLLGRETIKEWRLRIYHEEDKLKFKEKGKKVRLI